MKNNTSEKNQEFEKLFKSKMNELSSSVNCFDKISAKTFPQKDADFSESGFTVCELENITGKSKKPLFFKWIAVAVAFVLCIVIFPETSAFNNLIASLGKSPEKVYSKIIEEINRETSQNTYKVYDIPLEDYVKYNTLVTPFYPCPFTECGKNNINVRIFIRTYNDILTNQIYAVEYTNEYKESNFIAVADTKAKFTDEDFKNKIVFENSSENVVYSAIMANFTPADTAEAFIKDNENNKISLASFEYNNIFKDDNNQIKGYNSQILYYGDRNDEIPKAYYYDIYNAPDMAGTWKNTICFDGFSSMPEEDKSIFTRKKLFDGSESVNDMSLYGYITLADGFIDNDVTPANKPIDYDTLSMNDFMNESVSENASILAVPYDTDVLRTLKMYFSQAGMYFSSFSSPSIMIVSENTEYKDVIHKGDENYFDIESEITQSESEKKENEKETENNIISGQD